MLLDQLVNLTKIEHFVFYTIDILKSTFWKPSLNGHLTTLMSHLYFVTSTTLTAFITFVEVPPLPEASPRPNLFSL